MKRPALAFSGILLGMSASVLMQTLIATALPTIASELDGMSLYSWVFGSYMLASVVTIPLFARLADYFGSRALYLTGIAIFLCGALLAGFASSMGQLVAMRLLMGVGAGAVAPAALAAVGDLFQESRQGRAFGIIGGVQVLANLLGPLIGGLVTDGVGWRWGFFLVVPLGLLAAVTAGLGMGPHPQPATGWRRSLDWLGAALLGLALCAGLLGIQTVARGGESLLPGLAAVLLAAVLLLAALRQASRHPSPALPLPLLRLPMLGRAALGTVLVGVATYGMVAYLPLYVQQVQGGTATSAGAALMPMLLAAGAASGLGGWLADRGPRWLVIEAGWCLVGLGSMWLALLGLGVAAAPASVAAASALVGAGVGLSLPPFLLAAQHAAGSTQRATASGVIQLARNLGGALGVPLLAVWLPVSVADPLGPALSGIFFSLVGVAALGLLAGVPGRERREREVVGA